MVPFVENIFFVSRLLGYMPAFDLLRSTPVQKSSLFIKKLLSCRPKHRVRTNACPKCFPPWPQVFAAARNEHALPNMYLRWCGIGENGNAVDWSIMINERNEEAHEHQNHE